MSASVRTNVGVAESAGETLSFTVTKPTNAQQGDTLVACIATERNTIPVTAPDGTWTKIADIDSPDGAGQQLTVWTKTAGAGEPASYSFTTTPTATDWATICFALYGGTLTVYAADDGGDPTGPDLATGNLTTTSADDLVVSVFAQDQTGSDGDFVPSDPTNLTQLAEVWASDFLGLAVFTEQRSGATTDNHIVAQNGGGDNTRGGAWAIFAVHVASAAPGYVPVPNKTFELDAGNWQGTSATVARSTVEKHTGAASLLVTPSAGSGSGDVTPFQPASPSTIYRLSCWVFPTVIGTLRVAWNEYTAADVYITTRQETFSGLTVGQWTQLTVEFTTDAACAKVAPFVARDGAADPFYVDDVNGEQTPADPGGNLIVNQDFETDTAGWQGGTGATIARTTAQAHGGAASLLVTPVSADGSADQAATIAVTPSSQYTMTAWVRQAVAGQIAIAVNVFDANDVYLETIQSSYQLAADAWHEISQTVTIPASATKARPLVARRVSADAFYVDDVYFAPSAEPPPPPAGVIRNVRSMRLAARVRVADPAGGGAFQRVTGGYSPTGEPQPDPAPTGTDFPGLSPEGIAMCADAGASPSAADLQALAGIGFKVLRKEVSDARVLGAAQRGMGFLPLVYGEGDTFHGGSVQSVVNAVARYARGGTFWQANPGFATSVQPVWFEIGNEPYFSHEGMWATVASWARGWYNSAVAAKATNALVKVLLPVGLDINGPQGWRPFTDYVLDAEPRIAQVMDGWSHHPYCAGQDPAVYTNFSGGSNQFQRYNYIRQKLAARGVNKPWCISEFGFHTDALSQGVTEQQQADYLGRAYDIVAADPIRPFLFNFYTVKDYGDGSNQEHNFGFHFRRNGTVKPASATVASRAT